jgi:hypothetical protein
MMINNEINMAKWKLEQINYFKKYLSYFEENTKEFILLKRRIEELENTL